MAAAILVIGYLYASAFLSNKPEYPFHSEKIKEAVIKGRVSDIRLPKDNHFIFTLDADSLMFEDKVYPVKTKILCKLEADTNYQTGEVLDELEIGNEIVTVGTIYRPRNKRNPGEFDYREYLLTQNITSTLFISKSKIVVLDEDNDFIPDLIFKVRLAIDRRIHKLHSPEAAALLRGLLLADRSEIEFDTREKFVNAGVVHVLAVSGLHVGYIVLIFLFLTNRFNIYLRSFITIIGLLAFLLITGSPPSVFRASIMAIVFLVAQLSNRSTFGLNSLALAWMIILLLNPLELFNPGFQLSFSAVISILIIYPKIRSQINQREIKSKVLKNTLLFMGVSFSAQIGTMPFTLYYFHKLSIVSLFTNILVIPLVGVIVAVGIITLTGSMISMWVGLIYASANNIFTSLLNKIVNFSGGLEISHLFIREFSFYDSAVFYFLLIALITQWKKLIHIKAKLLFILFLSGSAAVYFQLDNVDLMPAGELSIMAIDIGQGDAILIRFPNEKTALIDAGNATDEFDNGERIIKPLLKQLGINKINFGFISHVDADHYKGFLYLIENNLVEKIYKPHADTSVQKDIDLQNFLISNRITYEDYSRDTINIGICRLYILNDTADVRFSEFSSNDKSGVIKLVYGSTSFLFVGDAGIEAENLLEKKYSEFLQSDLLKLGHHGSKTSSEFEFLELVNPDDALISAGIGNRFNHPSEEILQRLKIFKTNIHRTDKEGALLFRSNGKTIKKINWEKGN